MEPLPLGCRDDWDAQYLTDLALLEELGQVAEELRAECDRLEARWADEGRTPPSVTGFISRPVEGCTLLQLQGLLADRQRYLQRQADRQAESASQTRDRLVAELAAHDRREAQQQQRRRTFLFFAAGVLIGVVLSCLSLPHR